jgi:Spy/CpxP family protein refolding chaperone
MHSHPNWRGCAPRAFSSCHDPRTGHRSWGYPGEDMGDEGFGGFGVRRPLRFLADRLGLDERQMAALARVLDDLKTERAQAEVDRRRTLAAFADALGPDAFDAAKAAEAGELRVASSGRVRDAVIKALREIHAVLNPDQRQRLAYFIRTGTLTV